MANTFIDVVSKPECDILSKITFTQFKTLCSKVDGITVDDTLNSDEILTVLKNDDLYIQYNMIVKYAKEMIKNNYSMVQTYKPVSNKMDGRVYLEGDMGLQRIWGVIRGVLCNGLMLDIDMKNAHPTILLYLCKINNLMCLPLEGYVNNRDAILNEFMASDNIDKATAKMIFIMSLNFNKQIKGVKIANKQHKIKYPFFMEFDKSIKLLQIKLSDIYSSIYNKYKNDNNNYGKFTNELMCNNENTILKEVIKHITTIYGDIVINVPMFDGLMVSHKQSLHNIDQKEIVSVLDTLTSKYAIKWDIKQHNIEIQPYLLNLDISCNKLSFNGEHEVAVSQYVLDNVLYKKIYNCNGEVWIYHNNIWINNDIDKVIIPMLTKHDLEIDGYPIKDLKTLKAVSKLIELHAPENKKFNDLLHSDTLLKVCYTNGYWCFTNNKFIEYTLDNIPYTTFIINRDYVPMKYNEDDDNIKAVFKSILHPIFNIGYSSNTEEDEKQNIQYMWFILNKIARMLAGHIEDKKWLLFMGSRNSGKGVIQEILNTTFENYIGTFNSECLINKTAMGESEKMSAWLLGFRFSRIMFGNEVPTNDKQKLNGIMLKTIISGGDKITARRNNKDAISVNIQSSIILNTNDIPECSPTDAMETAITFNMPIKFMDDNEYDRLSANEKLIYKRGIKNTNIKTLCRTLNFQTAFESILYHAYTLITSMSEKHIIRNNDNDNDTNDDKRFFDFLEFGNTDEHKLTNNDLEGLKVQHNISISKLKMGNYLVSAGCTRYRTGGGRGFIGCKLINQ